MLAPVITQWQDITSLCQCCLLLQPTAHELQHYAIMADFRIADCRHDPQTALSCETKCRLIQYPLQYAQHDQRCMGECFANQRRRLRVQLAGVVRLQRSTAGLILANQSLHFNKAAFNIVVRLKGRWDGKGSGVRYGEGVWGEGCKPVASLASSGVVLVPAGALRLSTSSACPALLPAMLLADAACDPSAACNQKLAQFMALLTTT